MQNLYEKIANEAKIRTIEMEKSKPKIDINVSGMCKIKSSYVAHLGRTITFNPAISVNELHEYLA